MVARRSRAELVEAVRAGFQRNSGQFTILSQVVADKVGLDPSACSCLSLLEGGGPMTAGRVSELTWLTSGAVTRMIDRLEASGYVRRRRDPEDRRKLIIELVPGWGRDFETCYGPMARGTTAVLARYSDAELALFADLLKRSADFVHEQSVRIRALPDRPKRRVRMQGKILGQRVHQDLGSVAARSLPIARRQLQP